MLYRESNYNRVKKMGFLIVPLFLIAAVFLLQQARVSDQTATDGLICHGARARSTPDEAVSTIEGEAAADQFLSTTTTANIVDNGFGIAAGGNLVYWKQEDLNRFFQELTNLGVTWVRWDLDWKAIQPNNEQSYDWGGADRVANTAKKYGIKSLGIITYAPQWAQEGSCPSGKQCPPENYELFADFAGTVARRYKGTIDNWEIWNEPNYRVYWYPVPDAYDYTELLKAAYARIKEVNPSAIVVSAGLTDMGDEEDESISPLSFIETMYGEGAKDYFDILGLHPYTYPGYDYGWPQIKSVWQVMNENDDGEKKIWITEYGAPTGGPGRDFAIGEEGFSYGKDFMSEEAQSQMAKSIFAFQAENPNHIGNVFWYSLCDSSTDKSTTENFFGILRYDGTRKLVYQTLKDIFSRK
ncbi:MAG: cellulase family glycosylhydrolase [Candidatus Pacebacteria bacterium]|nr:cellulase family glycosylhydrolase [Candidatus Paceibacterota bacterium]